MAFIVVFAAAIWADEQQSVVDLAAGSRGQRTGDGQIVPGGLILHPLDCYGGFVFSDFFRIHGKTGGEHLGQYRQV